MGSSVRRSRGVWAAGARPEAGCDVGVGVEAEDRVGLGQRGRELVAVPLGQTADGDDLRARVRCGEQRVDRVLLRGVDEPAGVHHHDICALGIGDQLPSATAEPAGQLLGVDLVAGTAQRHERGAAGWLGHHSRLLRDARADLSCSTTARP
jgi:hypothetical protein